jgi:type IV secretory pathway VirD2 relaxase
MALPLTLVFSNPTVSAGGCMKDIHEVLRHKQAQYAQLGKQIELLQQAAEKLREVAPLLAETEGEDESPVLMEVDDENSNAMAAKASAQSSPAASKPGRSITPRWP